MEQNDSLLTREQGGNAGIWQCLRTYVKKNGKRLLKIGGFSFLFVLIVILLMRLLSHQEHYYSLQAYVVLEKQRGAFVYPNGKKFSPMDIVSPLVLDSVYKNFKLEDKVSFQKFCTLFSTARSDAKVSKVDAKYMEAYARTKQNFINLHNLGMEYEREKDFAKDTILILSMFDKIDGLSKREASNILHAVLDTWYYTYSKMEARSFPNFDVEERLKKIGKTYEHNSLLIPLEKARSISSELLSMCNLLNTMLQGENVCLKSGETLGDLTEQIAFIQRRRLNDYRQYVLTHPEQQLLLDKYFLLGILDDVENTLTQLMLTEVEIEDAMYIVSDRKKRDDGKLTMSKDTKGTTSLPLNAGFFNSIADLIHNESISGKLSHYAEALLKNNELRAEQESERDYYLKMFNSSEHTEKQSSKEQLISGKDLQGNLTKAFADLQTIGKKIMQIRDIILQNYLASRKFYSSSSDAGAHTENSISMKRVSSGLIFLWMLCFGSFVTIDFLRKRSQDDFSVNPENLHTVR